LKGKRGLFKFHQKKGNTGSGDSLSYEKRAGESTSGFKGGAIILIKRMGRGERKGGSGRLTPLL